MRAGLHRPGGGEAARPASAGKAHQQGLGHVIPLVAHPKSADPASPHFLAEKCEPCGARVRLADAARTGPAAQPRSRGEIHPEGPAGAPAEFGVGPGRGSPQPVVEMQNANPLPARRPVRPNKKQQGDGVRSPRKSDCPSFGRRPGVRPGADRRMEPAGRDQAGQGIGPRAPTGFRGRSWSWCRRAQQGSRIN